MKRYLVKIKRAANIYTYFLLISLFLSLILAASLPGTAQPNEKNSEDSFVPALIVVEGGTGPAEEVALHLSQELVMNDFAVTVGITPYLNKKGLTSSDSQVKELRNLYNLFPERISFALQGLEHIENELEGPLSEQIDTLSRAQSIFTQAFNQDQYGYFLLATTLLPYGQYNSDIAAAARQAGIKMIISNKANDSNSYSLLECDVAEIHAHSKASMIADWDSLRIKSPEEFIESINDAIKESFPENPLVMIVNAGILHSQLGAEKAREYTDTLISLLEQLREREEIQFITSAEYYDRFVGGKQYIVLRLDDYQTSYGKWLFEKMANRIAELDVPLTIGIITNTADKLSEDYQAIEYLKSMLEKGLIEVALNIYSNREDGEFTLSLNEQTDMLRDALLESEKILSHDQVFGIIPPYDKSNEFISEAIETVNREGQRVRVISSGIVDKYMFGFDPQGIYHISRTISPLKSYSPPYSFYSVEEILTSIGHDDAVLNIHPWNLEEEEKQDTIIEVIKHLKERPNVEFVTLRDFYFNIDPTLRLALGAWKYFKENTESSTGLVYPNVIINDDYTYKNPKAAIWDIASSLLGIASAEKLGIISLKEGIHRITKILDFLQTCELYQGQYPNFTYDVTTTQMVKEGPGIAWDDLARMLTALKIIKTHYPSLEDNCNSVIERWVLIPVEGLYQPDKDEEIYKEVKTSPYWDYMDASFGLWGYRNEPVSLWASLKNKMYGLFSGSEPDYYDRLLIPESYILQAIEMGQTEKGEEILDLIHNVQEARYKHEGIITSISEGDLDRKPWFVYCGLVVSEEGFTIWPVVGSIWQDGEGYPEYRFISSKAAIAWQALKENDYSRLSYDLIRRKALNYQFGFYTGIYEESQKINNSLSVNTNGIILESLWFKKRGKIPLVYSGQSDVPDVEGNMLSSIEKKIGYFYSQLLEKLKIKSEENYNVKED